MDERTIKLKQFTANNKLGPVKQGIRIAENKSSESSKLIIKSIDTPCAHELVMFSLRLLRTSSLPWIRLFVLTVGTHLISVFLHIPFLTQLMGYAIALYVYSLVAPKANLLDSRLSPCQAIPSGFVGAGILSILYLALDSILTNLGMSKFAVIIISFAFSPFYLAILVSLFEDKTPLAALQDIVFLLKDRWLYFYFTSVKLGILIVLLLLIAMVLILLPLQVVGSITSIEILHYPSKADHDSFHWLSLIYLIPFTFGMTMLIHASSCVWYQCLTRISKTPTPQ